MFAHYNNNINNANRRDKMNRQQAERNYRQALAAQRTAENISEAAFLAAKERLDSARACLVAAEIEQPTAKEYSRRTALLRIRNRGLDA